MRNKNFALVILVFVFISNFAYIPAKAAPVENDTLGTWIDHYSDSTGLSTLTNTTVNVASTTLTLSGANLSGSAQTVIIDPGILASWGTLTVSSTVPASTTLNIKVQDNVGNLYPDSILPGNSAGFSGTSINLSGVPIDQSADTAGNGLIGKIRFLISMTRSTTTANPSLDALTLTWIPKQGDMSSSTLSSSAWPEAKYGNNRSTRAAAGPSSIYPIMRWKSNIGYAALPVLVRGAGDNVYMKTDGTFLPDSSVGPSILRAISKTSGTTIWNRNITGFIFSDNDIALSENGTLYWHDVFNDVLGAYNSAAGTVKWLYKFGSGHGNQDVTIGPDGKIYLSRRDGNEQNFVVYAFNPNGTVAWTSTPLPATTSVAMSGTFSFSAGGTPYFAVSTVNPGTADRNGGGKLFALNPSTGATAWSYPTGDIGGVLSPVVGSDGTIYVANEGSSNTTKKVYAINPDGSLLWQRSLGTTTDYYDSLSLRRDGTLLADRVSSVFPSAGGSLEAMNPATGALLWSTPLSSMNDVILGGVLAGYNNNAVVSQNYYGATTSVSSYDSGGNPEWSFAINDGTDRRIYGNGIIEDEDGSIYFTIFDNSGNTSDVIKMSSWNAVMTSPMSFVSQSYASLTASTTMPRLDPLTGAVNQMQLVWDDGTKTPLAYSSTASNGDTIWSAAFQLPASFTPGNHAYTLEANTPNIKTATAVHFASPAVGSSGTGLAVAGTLTITSPASVAVGNNPTSGWGGSFTTPVGNPVPHEVPTVATGSIIISPAPTSTAPAPGSPKFRFNKNLKLGDKGNDVLELQKYLNDHGFKVAVSGVGSAGHETQYFGMATRRAVIALQEANSEKILAPSGFRKGTGMFYSATRAFVNANP